MYKIALLAVASSLLTAWFSAQLLSPAAQLMAAEVAVVQALAEEVTDSVAVRLFNDLGCVPWLGPLRPELLAPHSAACAAPSLALRLVPLVGDSVLVARLQEYKACVRLLLRRGNAAHVSLVCVLPLAAGLVGALAWLLHRRGRSHRHGEIKSRGNSYDKHKQEKEDGKLTEVTEKKEKEDNGHNGQASSKIEKNEPPSKEKREKLKGRKDTEKPLTKITVFEDKKTEHEDLKENTTDIKDLHEKSETKNSQEKTENDALTDHSGDSSLLLRRVPVLTPRQVRALRAGRLLDRGGFASVRRVTFAGGAAVLKELHDPAGRDLLLKEARLAMELDGAGGVPRVLAVCPNPAAMVLEFVGRTYDEFVLKCHVGGLLESLASVCRRLGEIHARGIVHNDVKINNITFTGGVQRPVFHIIDLGWACRAGQVAGEFIAESTRKARAARRRPVMATSEASCSSVEASADETYDYRYEDDAEDSEFEFGWMAPEVRVRQPVWPSGDVYSLGFLLKEVLSVSGCRQDFVAAPLRRLADQCSAWDPRRRPGLSRVELDLARLREQLSPRRLAQSLRGGEEAGSAGSGVSNTS